MLSHPECNKIISIDDNDVLIKNLSIGTLKTELDEMSARIKADLIEKTKKEIQQSEARQHNKIRTLVNLLRKGSIKISH